jgi:hypothetical protein
LSANPGWATGFNDHPAEPISQDCWNRLADARVSIIAARMAFETAQRAPGPYQSSLVAEGNKRLNEARTFLALASDCYGRAQTALANLKHRGTTGTDDDSPAASTLIQANAIAGQIIEDLKFLFGAEEIEELSHPQSHGQNALTATQLAIQEYLTTGVLGAAAMRLTKGQMNNFIGGIGQKIMQDLFPESIPKKWIKEAGREVDLWDPVNKIAREIKTGSFDLNSARVRGEIAKDARLVKEFGYRVEWWNLKSPIKGQSFSPELIAELQRVGIVPVSHINP